MKKNAVIRIRNLTKAFKGKEVISKLNMTVEQGSIYGFLGANGAGKTTVFKLMTGLLQPISGMIEILGMDLSTHRNEILRNSGMLIETPIFYDHISARENLEIHLAYIGLSYKPDEIDNTLEKVGLINLGNRLVGEFSLGMRQRLGIARAIIHKPRLLILDEPINGMDPVGIKEMRDLFLSLTKEGTTIIISSHILSEMEHVADTIGVIANGSIVEEVSLKEIQQQHPDGLEDYYFKMMSGGRNI